MLSMSRHIRFPALLALIVLTVSTVGCSSWRRMPPTDPTSDEWASLIGKDVALATDDRVVTLRVERVEYPYIYGYEKRWGRSRNPKQYRVDLREVLQIRVEERDLFTPVVITLGIVTFLGLSYVIGCRNGGYYCD